MTEEQAYEIWNNLSGLGEVKLRHNSTVSEIFVAGVLAGQPKWKKFKAELPPVGRDFLWKSVIIKNESLAAATWTGNKNCILCRGNLHFDVIYLQTDYGDDEWQLINY